MDVVSWLLSKSYVDKTLRGMGALKGSPAMISSIIDNPDGTHDIAFSWKDNSDVTHTSILTVANGETPTITSTEIEGGHTITFATTDPSQSVSFNVMDGEEGQRGVSVIRADVDANNYLKLELSDGNIINAGQIKTVSMVDNTLSLVSENPVQNKVITKKFDEYKTAFTGTEEEWNALTSEEQNVYDIMNITNDGDVLNLGVYLEKKTAMPVASEDVENKIYLYTGTTTQDYKKGVVYQCVSDGEDPATYSWVALIDFGTAAIKNSTDRVSPNNTDLVESQSVYSAINTALSSIYTPRGDITCAELTSALLISDNIGNVYETSDSGTTTALFLQGAGHPIATGDNVGIINAGEGRILFNLMANAFDLTDYQKKDLTSAVEGQTTVESALGALSTNKASKVSGATNGNFAGLDASGNLTDSGKKPSDFQTVLTFDNVPTENSNNPVKSGGVYSLKETLTNEISARTNADSLINTRIDEIIAPSGKAPSAAEITDARIGVDGVTYSTLGNAIRGQIIELNNAFSEISENYENLYSVGLIRLGENWTGGIASNRAVAYVEVKPSTTYFINIPTNEHITAVQVIEKAQNTGASGSLHLTSVVGGNTAIVTTTANTNYFCLQFEGNMTLASTDFENYDVYVCEGESQDYSAVDKVAREEVNSNTEVLGRIISYKNIDLTDYEIRGKYINDLGKEIISSSTYAITQPIPVAYGCKYSFVGTGTTIISAICECDKQGTITKSVYRYSANGKEESFDYTPDADGYVILSYNYANDFAFDSVFYDSIADVNDKFNTERSNNLYNPNNVIVGKNWTGGSASNRAITYIKTKKSTKYIIDFCLTNPNITTARIIEKNRTNSGSLNTAFVTPGSSIEYTTSSLGNVICIQFEGTSDITSSQIEDVYLQIFESFHLHYVDKGINTYNTFREMVEVGEIAEGRIGEMVISPIVSNPEQKYQTQGVSAYPYFDVNATLKQYKLLNGSKRIPNEYILNNLPQEEIDFTPTNAGFNRTIVFKDVDDRFFITNQASDRLGQFGDARYDVLEMTTDFKNFTTVLRCSDSPLSAGIPVPGMTYVKVTYMKQFADGSYILCINCNSLSENKSEAHFYKLSADLQTLTHCNYVNFDGNTVEMVDEFNNGGYDWSCFVDGSKALATTYGSRNPENDYGRVWYTEDNGEHWKQVFQTNTHLQEGGRDGATVTQAHTHGVMIDPYTGRLFVIVGEDIDTVFWNDNGMDANNDNWQTIMLAKQSYYNFSDFIQAVNGYALENCLLLGSDNEGSGGIYRINKLKDGTYSKAEMAHEVLPNNFMGTFYCAGELSRRDSNSPLLMCITREGAAETESANEQLNRQNLGRVVATYDGFNFTEIWKDDTYGAHDVYINNAIESRNFAYCTRGMNCWILKNGDAVIKYSGRDYYYFGAAPLFSARGFSNASNKVLWIKNADKYI